MLTKVYAAAIQGINATLVTIEVNALRGIQFFLVGLPDNAVKESYHRIHSALQHNGLKFPSKKIIVNMAPADIRKEGSAYDLPIAIGILAADGIINSGNLDKYIIMGELGLDGGLMPVKGILPIAIKAKELGCFAYGKVVATVENGKVIRTAKENRDLVYKAMGIK
jgi:magnesium chelatase family protein